MPGELPLDDQMLKAVLDCLNAGVYVTDRDRRIILWNRKAAELTGYPASEVVGKACHENVLVHADKDGHELCHTDHCPLYRSMQVERQSTEPALVYAKTAGGRRLAVTVSVAPLKDASGEVVGGVEVFRDETERLADLEMARKVQRNLLPGALPDQPPLRFEALYYPRGLVGGDFYEVRQLGPGRWGLLLADVSGHGVSAALYTMQIKSLEETCREHAEEPAAFLGALNRELSRFVVAESFATALYAVVDVESRRLTYASAAHPPPIHLRARDGTAARLPAEGAPLGIMPELDYEAQAAELEPGDTVLAYTDGATEVRDAEGQMIGTDGLARFAREERASGERRLLERIYERVKAVCADVLLPDDFTLLSASWQGRPGALRAATK